MKKRFGILFASFILVGCTSSGIGSGYSRQPIITPTYSPVPAGSNTNPCGLSTSDDYFSHAQGVGNPGQMARDFAVANSTSLRGAATYMGVCMQNDAARQAVRYSYGDNGKWSQDQKTQKPGPAKLRDPRFTLFLEKLKAFPGGTTPSTSEPESPKTGKDATLPLSMVAPATLKKEEKAAPTASAVGTDLRSGITAANNYEELIAVFQREIANPADPRMVREYRNILSKLRIEAMTATPKRFKAVQGQLATAY